MAAENAQGTVDKGAATAADDAQKRERSSIAFPYMDLGDAVEVAFAIHKNVGTASCTADQLAPWLKQSPTSSAFRIRLATTKTFGLIDPEGAGAVKLSETGRMLVDPKREREARASAFLNVPLYRAMFEKFKGSVLPPTAALEREIVTLGVAEKQKERARQVFERSAEQANFFEAGRDRLVRPGIASREEEPAPKQQREEKEEHGGGGGKPPLDPLLKGLVDRLPKADSDWSGADRIKWLQTAANIFDLIYKGDGTGVEIRPAMANRSPRPD